PEGGALARMLPAFKLGLGGRLGGGGQFWSWIALADVVRLIGFILESDSVSGPVNVVAPNAVTNAEFTTELASVLRRPAALAVPRFAVEQLFGEMAREMMLASIRAKPTTLLQSGFSFRWPDLAPALEAMLRSQKSR